MKNWPWQRNYYNVYADFEINILHQKRCNYPKILSVYRRKTGLSNACSIIEIESQDPKKIAVNDEIKKHCNSFPGHYKYISI